MPPGHIGKREGPGRDGARGDTGPWLYGIATNLISRRWRDEIRPLRALSRTGSRLDSELSEDQVIDKVAAQAAAATTTEYTATSHCFLADTPPTGVIPGELHDPPRSGGGELVPSAAAALDPAVG